MKNVIPLFAICCCFFSCDPELPEFWPTEITIKVRNLSGERIDSLKLKAVNGFEPHLAWVSTAADSIFFDIDDGKDTTIVWQPEITGYGHIVLGKEGYLLSDSLGHIQKYYQGSRFESSDPAYNTFLKDSVLREKW